MVPCVEAEDDGVLVAGGARGLLVHLDTVLELVEAHQRRQLDLVVARHVDRHDAVRRVNLDNKNFSASSSFNIKCIFQYSRSYEAHWLEILRLMIGISVLCTAALPRLHHPGCCRVTPGADLGCQHFI